ncbi:MAG: amidase family protein [Alphaproteobacteria bacterium]|jgi:aspartyl-tRNA(Asn)/glutamyl-tRNA(Gln) amidotransferase subunit A|nr:amidase family protein [Alphaproteobacteria bacterium]
MGRNWHRESACDLGDAIGRGEIDASALCEHFLDRIDETDDGRIYVRTTAVRARAEAAAASERATAGARRSRLDGVPISWKDLYDTAGIATEGGTPLLAGRVPERDAIVLERASRAGMICLGKTNTVQFALGGIGTNPATGTPANAVLEDVPRAPGGSSCGAATSVARGLAAAGIGSDTGGSVRIPAAWNRLVGLKTSFGALPCDGVLPLSPSLDTVGPLTRDVADAAALFAIMAARPAIDLAGATLSGSRFLVATDVVWDDADAPIVEAVEQAIAAIEAAGAVVERGPVPEFTAIDDVLNQHGGVVTAEGYVSWRRLIDEQGQAIDPAVLARFHQGRDMAAADVEIVRGAIRELTPALYARMAGYSAILAPTVPILPPPIADVIDDADAYARANGLALRNTRLGNMLPCCALTLPCGAPDVPAGLMAMAPVDDDARLLRVGAAIEMALKT